ncbi:MAG: ABC transporter permease, partial [Candidatus Nitrosopolaris sp.]
ENRLPLHKKVSGNSRSTVSTVRRRVKKKHRNLKQIFILSLDSLRERKVRSALTVLMVVVGGALMVAINGISAGSAVFINKQIGTLAPNVIFVGPGSKSKTFQEAPGLATTSPRLPFNHEVVSRIKSLPFVKDVVPAYQAQVQLHVAGDNVPGDILNINVGAMNARAMFIISPSLTLIPGSKIEGNNPSAMLVGYDIANPPGYTHNPLIRLGQTVTATFDGISRNFVVTGILAESGNPNVDRIVRINTNAGNSFFHKLGQYDEMIVLARSGSDVSTVVHEMTRLYGSDSFGIVSPAAIMEAQQHLNGGSSSFTLEVGYIALLAGAIGVVTTLWTSVNERTKEIGTMKAIGAKPWFILSMFLSDAILIGLIGSTVGIFTGIGLAYLLSVSGTSVGGPSGASHIAPIFLPNDLVRVWLLSLTISLAAGVFPAWKGSRLSPLVAMRT